MRRLIQVVSFLSLVVCVIWAVMKPGYDSFAATVAAVVVLLSSFLLSKKSNDAAQSQKVEAGGVGIQAGGDVKMNKTRIK